MWNLTSNPVKFGHTANLSCYIKNNDNSCNQKLRQWLGGREYSSICQNMKCSDDDKYHVTVTTPCSYTLIISNFSMNDVDCDYSCFYGSTSYRKRLPLSKSFICKYLCYVLIITITYTLRKIYKCAKTKGMYPLRHIVTKV